MDLQYIGFEGSRVRICFFDVLPSSVMALESAEQTGAKIQGCIFESKLNTDVNLDGPVEGRNLNALS